MKKLALALVASVCATSAMAEITIGTVNGLVTATSGGQLVNVTPGMKLPDGAQLNVPSGASVQVSMPGCSASVGPGSVAMSLATCQSIQASAAGGGGVGGGGFGGFSTGTVIGGVAGVGALGYAINRNNRNSTPVVTPTPTPRPSNS